MSAHGMPPSAGEGTVHRMVLFSTDLEPPEGKGVEDMLLLHHPQSSLTTMGPENWSPHCMVSEGFLLFLNREIWVVTCHQAHSHPCSCWLPRAAPQSTKDKGDPHPTGQMRKLRHREATRTVEDESPAEGAKPLPSWAW